MNKIEYTTKKYQYACSGCGVLWEGTITKWHDFIIMYHWEDFKMRGLEIGEYPTEDFINGLLFQRIDGKFIYPCIDCIIEKNKRIVK